MAKDESELSEFERAFNSLMLEIEHQMRVSSKKFFGVAKLELTYSNGELLFVRVSSERTMRTRQEK